MVLRVVLACGHGFDLQFALYSLVLDWDKPNNATLGTPQLAEKDRSALHGKGLLDGPPRIKVSTNLEALDPEGSREIQRIDSKVWSRFYGIRQRQVNIAWALNRLGSGLAPGFASRSTIAFMIGRLRKSRKPISFLG